MLETQDRMSGGLTDQSTLERRANPRTRLQRLAYIRVEPDNGAIVVDADGKRFADESVGYSGFTAAVARAATPTTAIFDQTIIDIAAREPWFKEVLDYGGAKRAADLGQLASASGLSQRALEATLAAYNRAAKGEIPDPWGRTDFGLAPLRAPFWYARVVPALLSTQGGLAVDSRGRVLRPDNTPIPNLFAAGGAVAGIAGRSGGRGYASGTGLLHAIGLGFIAGRASVAELSMASG